MSRLFLAIFPPKEYLDVFRDTLRRFGKEKRNLTFVPVDQMHVTMRFLGSQISEESKELLINELKLHEGNYGKAILNIKKIQFGFPMETYPKILMADIEDNESMLGITNRIHSIVKKLDLYDTINWKERKSTSYHITLARMKEKGTRKHGKFIQKITKELQTPKLEPALINEMYLMESVIQHGKAPVHRKIETIKL